jgi:hypothetical protein
MKFCTKFALVVLIALICSQVVPTRPLASVNAQRKSFREFVSESDSRRLASFIGMFDERTVGGEGTHRMLNLFCKNVAVFVCAAELSRNNATASVRFFCEEVLNRCWRYSPESIK